MWNRVNKQIKNYSNAGTQPALFCALFNKTLYENEREDNILDLKLQNRCFKIDKYDDRIKRFLNLVSLYINVSNYYNRRSYVTSVYSRSKRMREIYICI